MNTKIIKLDLNRILYDKIIAKQGDTKSRFLLFQLLDGSIAFNLTNRSVRAYMVKPDGKEIFNDLIINNYSLGYCTLELTNQVLAVPGTVKIELMVTEEDRKLTSSVFELEVIKSINSEKSIVSTNEFTALLNGLSSLSEYDNYKNEIAAARDGESNLLTKVKKIDEQLDNNVRKIEMNKTDIDVERQRINNFTTLPGGSTTGDAELIDGRIDSLGFSYPNIGGNIRSFQETIYNSGDLKIDCGEWENGIISTTSGNNAENDKTKFARIKDFIGVPVGKTITFNVIASGGYIPKLTLYYYDESRKFIKALAVENKSIIMEHPYVKLCYFYESTPADILLSDAMKTNITTKVELNGVFDKIPQLKGLFDRLDKIPNMVGTINANKSIDFNDYKIGYYFIDCPKDKGLTYPLRNSPFNAKWGYYELLSIPFTVNFTLQLAICSNGAKRGMFIRTYNTSTNTNQIDWKVIDSDLSRSFNKYIALGDSITWGHISGNGSASSPFVRADYPYPTTVANALGLDVIYGAQTGCGWLQLSGNKTAISIVDSIDFSDYNLVTLAFGRNDHNGNKPLGNKTDMYPAQETILGAMNYCLKKIYTDAPTINVVVITPLNEATKGNSNSNYAYGTANDQGYTLKELCTAIRELCEEKNVNCIDNSKGSIVTAYNCNSGIFIDKLHPTNTFYRALGQYYAGKIGSFFQSSRNY